MTLSEFKPYFSDAVKRVKAGEKIAVTSGKRKEIVGYFVPEIQEKKGKRVLGILEGKTSMVIHPDLR